VTHDKSVFDMKQNVFTARRQFLIGTSGVALGVLAGCVAAPPSAAPSAQTPTQAPNAPAPAAETSGTFPVSVTHKFGATEIKAEPRRVIALGFSDQDPILALGVKPIATRFWWGDESMAAYPWAVDELGDAKPEVLNMTELNFEKIATLKPDLIIATYAGISEKEYATLSQIAPTVAQSSAYADYGMPWQETTLMIGQALGREPQARALIAEIEDRFAAIRARHPEYAGKSVIIGAPDDKGQFGFMASQDPRSRVFAALGFKVPEAFDKIANGQFYGTISTERLDLLNTDLLVFHQLQWVKGGRAAIETNPLLSKLTTMKEGRAVFLEGELDDAFQFSSVLSLPLVLDQMLPRLEAALGRATAAVAVSAFPLVITHEDGETTFTQPVQRIVTLSEEMMELPLALGLQPIGTASERTPNAERGKPFKYSYSPAVSTAEVIYLGKESEPSFEAIAALKPDLIITPNGYGKARYETLSKIAPTLTYDGADRLYWKAGLAALAQLTGKEAEARQVSADFDAALMQARAKLEPVVKTRPRLALLFLPAPTQTYMVNQQFSFGAIFADLGMQIVSPADTVFNEAGSAQVSNEPVALLETDAYVIFRFGTDRFPIDALLAKNPAPKLDCVINTQRPASGPISDFDYLRDLTALLVGVN